jgi:hypothetical protein
MTAVSRGVEELPADAAFVRVVAALAHVAFFAAAQSGSLRSRCRVQFVVARHFAALSGGQDHQG